MNRVPKRNLPLQSIPFIRLRLPRRIIMPPRRRRPRQRFVLPLPVICPIPLLLSCPRRMCKWAVITMSHPISCMDGRALSRHDSNRDGMKYPSIVPIPPDLSLRWPFHNKHKPQPWEGRHRPLPPTIRMCTVPPRVIIITISIITIIIMIILPRPMVDAKSP